MSEMLLMWILGGAFACIGVVFGITTKKLDKKDFEKHCENDRDDKKDMYKTLNDMNQKLTEVHTIIKRDQR